MKNSNEPVFDDKGMGAFSKVATYLRGHLFKGGASSRYYGSLKDL